MAEARAISRRSDIRLWLAGGWLLVALLAAIFAPLIAPQDPLAQDLMYERLPPFWMQGAEPGFWLGTDSLGRDLLSRLIYGGRVAFIVAFAAARAACLRRLDARADRGLFRRLAGPHHLAHRRRLDGVPAGALRHPAGRRLRHGPRLRHHRHRRHRLDALLPRHPRRGDEPVAHGLCRERQDRRLRAPAHHGRAKCCPTCCRRSSRCCRWRWASR